MSEKPNKEVEGLIGDSLLNLVSGMGTAADKRSATQHSRAELLTLDYVQLEAMYAENWLAQKVVNVVPKDMTREWRRFNSRSMSPEEIEAMTEEETRLQLKKKVRLALMWSRLYGGAALIPIIAGEKGGDLSQPIDFAEIDKGSLVSINVMDSRNLHQTGGIELDPFDANYLKPKYYAATGTVGQIHHSRIIRFEGNPIPYHEKRFTRYWGQSVLEPINGAIKDAMSSSSSISSLLQELRNDVISIDGLAAAMAAGREEQVKKRFEAYHYLKSIWGISLLDSTEKLESHQLSMSGWAEVSKWFYEIVSGATDIPVTRLLATSPAGMNATGESDIRNYYDMVSNEQEDALLEPLNTLDKMMARNIWGSVPGSLSFEFLPLWQESQSDKVARELSAAQRDQIYLMNNIVSEDIVLRQLQETQTYNNISDEYIKEVEDALNEPDDLEDESNEGGGDGE